MARRQGHIGKRARGQLPPILFFLTSVDNVCDAAPIPPNAAPIPPIENCDSAQLSRGSNRRALTGDEDTRVRAGMGIDGGKAQETVACECSSASDERGARLCVQGSEPFLDQPRQIAEDVVLLACPPEPFE